jgi:phosphate-selective porin OprO/OprP
MSWSWNSRSSNSNHNTDRQNKSENRFHEFAPNRKPLEIESGFSRLLPTIYFIKRRTKSMKQLLSTLLIAALALMPATGANASKLTDALKEKGIIATDFAPDIEPRGRLHLDAGWHDEDVTEFGDGFANRRARLGLQGRLAADWSFVIEYDFAENGTSANDVMLSGKFFGGSLNIGQFKVPMGLDELTSSNASVFIERAADSNTIVDSRRLGIGYDYHAGQFGIQSMVYGRAIGGKQDGDMPMGIGGRVYANPIKDENMLMHIGASAAYENRQDYNTLRYRERPEARADADVRLIDTGTITDVDDTIKAGLELALVFGPFSTEAEYLMADINRETGEEPTFKGYHVQASYFLTGETRGYRNGVFRGITPKNNWGAFEAAARWSCVDLNDDGFDGSGKQENITLGLNYYATSNVRFMANYIMVDVTDRDPSKIAGGEDSPNIFLLRAAFYF